MNNYWMHLFANPVSTSQNMLIIYLSCIAITHIGEPLVKYTDYMYTVGLVNFNNVYCFPVKL